MRSQIYPVTHSSKIAKRPQNLYFSDFRPSDLRAVKNGEVNTRLPNIQHTDPSGKYLNIAQDVSIWAQSKVKDCFSITLIKLKPSIHPYFPLCAGSEYFSPLSLKNQPNYKTTSITKEKFYTTPRESTIPSTFIKTKSVPQQLCAQLRFPMKRLSDTCFLPHCLAMCESYRNVMWLVVRGANTKGPHRASMGRGLGHFYRMSTKLPWLLVI